jgi:membrane protein DedA with SNARE-associated domain
MPEGRPFRDHALMVEFIATYGVWLVAGFIFLETMGAPLPAEAALMAAGFFAARSHDLDIRVLIVVGSVAAILGNVAGFWIGRRYGTELLMRFGSRVGLTEGRIRIGQWLFARYGGRFVFVARFLPFLRNMAAILAGTNSMPQPIFYVASGIAAILWVALYGVASFLFGEAVADLASPAAIVLGVVAVAIIVAIPSLILRYEERLLAKAACELPSPPLSPT